MTGHPPLKSGNIATEPNGCEMLSGHIGDWRPVRRSGRFSARWALVALHLPTSGAPTLIVPAPPSC
ncbi:hypothetical protein SBA4_2510033 [Candidatus Sulfopaludibacter sp. SbA4]|nr:hypothetical protein SBA4_2510033 [Candidatus Sulfopaludibacter sp. SbA4]